GTLGKLPNIACMLSNICDFLISHSNKVPTVFSWFAGSLYVSILCPNTGDRKPPKRETMNKLRRRIRYFIRSTLFVIFRNPSKSSLFMQPFYQSLGKNKDHTSFVSGGTIPPATHNLSLKTYADSSWRTFHMSSV